MTSPRSPFYQRRAFRRWFAAALGLGLVLLAARLALDPALANHDVGWTLYAGAQMLDGAEHSVDIIDTNPPLIYWITMLLNAVARLFGVPALLLYNLSVIALIFTSAYFCWKLLGPAIESELVRYSIALFIPSALAVAAGFSFGQREQIIAALILPYVLTAGLPSNQAPSRGVRAIFGLGLGIGISIKPHFLLAWLAVELVVMVRRRSLRSWNRLENWIMASIGIGYLTLVLLGAPEYFELTSDIALVYSAYDNPVPLWSPEVAVTAGALMLLVGLRPQSSLGGTSASLLAASIGSFLVILSQKKGYNYHYIPMLVTASISAIFAIADLVEKSPNRTKRLFLALTYPSTIVALVGGLLFTETHPERLDFVKVIDQFGQGEPVLFFSSSVGSAFPLLLFTESESTSPYSCLWLIPGHYSAEQRRGHFPYRSLSQMSSRERKFLTGMVDALEGRRPGLLFFDREANPPIFESSNFEYERYFAADTRFPLFMADYRQIEDIPPFAVYLRKDLTAGGRTDPLGKNDSPAFDSPAFG